jgi:hypothetical protein
MNPHASHVLASLFGVRVCRRCLVNVDWPLIVAPCGAPMADPVPASKRTKSRLRKRSVSDRVIARDLERGTPIKQIARLRHAGKERIRRIAEERAIPTRPQGRPRKAGA